MSDETSAPARAARPAPRAAAKSPAKAGSAKTPAKKVDTAAAKPAIAARKAKSTTGTTAAASAPKRAAAGATNAAQAKTSTKSAPKSASKSTAGSLARSVVKAVADTVAETAALVSALTGVGETSPAEKTAASTESHSDSPNVNASSTNANSAHHESAMAASSGTTSITEELQNVGADVVPSVPLSGTREDGGLTAQSSDNNEQIEARGSFRDSSSSELATSANSDANSDAQRGGGDGNGGGELQVAGPARLITDGDVYLFNEGSHSRLYDKLGAHLMERNGVRGTYFAVWAPNAASVSVIGDFNGWDTSAFHLEAVGASGIWDGFIPGVEQGALYKYFINSRVTDYRVAKTDPFGFHQQLAPETASIVWNLDYQWNDADWMQSRAKANAFDAPTSVYEVHLGSWRRIVDENGPRFMTYREAAQPLAEYAKKMNFTHVELLPIMEHPFYGSWGYQKTGYFAPTSRYGTPQDLMYLVDHLHQNGIGVILDWVPSHFPTDEHALGYFDGTHLFEHADPRKGFHPDWNSLIFNYGRNEVRSFLLSSAIYWLDKYHVDGLRVDAVASMLYLDYSRKHGEWIPNEHGGRENLEAISFLRRMNEDVYKSFPDVQVIAEESTSWPMVSRPTYVGGLGFGEKWDMGWMHDTLRYFSNDPIHRRYHHNELTFRMMYAFTENFVLPLSHDEVVHGKGSLIGKMPGDAWQKFANLRLLFAHMFSQPGKKLLFMGGEFGQVREWNHDSSLDWHLLGEELHATLQRWFEDLNKMYRTTPAMHELDMSPDGFEWIDCCDSENSVLALIRRGKSDPEDVVVAVLNFTPLPRYNYQIGVPKGGRWREVLNSDATIYGGSGQGNMGGVDAVPIPLHGRKHSITLTLPPLGAVFLMHDDVKQETLDVAADANRTQLESETQIGTEPATNVAEDREDVA
jgi:1,4-alpha-glucan branching enzyme